MAAQSSSMILALNVVFSFLQWVFVAMRLGTRKRLNIRFGWDDHVILISAILSTVAYTIPLGILTTRDHLGDHVPQTPSGQPIPPSDEFNLWGRIVLTGSPLPVGLTKISVILLYRRIFSGKIFDIVSWTVLGLSIVWTISNFFGDVFQCVHPISVDTVHLVPGEKCIDTITFYYAAAGSDVILDLIIILIPLPIIWKLNMAPIQKLAVTGIFLCGLLTVACSVTRMAEFVVAGNTIRAGSMDYTWNYAPTFYWSFLESSIGIISACLITLRPMFRRSTPSTLDAGTARPSAKPADSQGSSLAQQAPKRTYTQQAPNFDYTHVGTYDRSMLGYKASVDTCAMCKTSEKQEGIVVSTGWGRSERAAFV